MAPPFRPLPCLVGRSVRGGCLLFPVCPACDAHACKADLCSPPSHVDTFGTFGNDIVCDIGTAIPEDSQQRDARMVVEHLDPNPASGDDLGAPVADPVAEHPAHLALPDRAEGLIDPDRHRAALRRTPLLRRDEQLQRLTLHGHGIYRRFCDIGQPAKEGPVSDPKATFDDAALTGSICPKCVVRRHTVEPTQGDRGRPTCAILACHPCTGMRTY